jgi:GT2 family glycosyltransferase
MEFFLENSKGGKIILDETVKKVLQAINKHTFDEVNQKKLVSTRLLDTLLKVFTRVGVLKGETNPGEPLQPLEENPLVSIVIVNYNGDKHLPELLESLKQQTYKHREVIVVDNHSTDNACQWVKAHYPECQLKELNKNIGFAAAVNTGIKEAAGDFILVLNNDIVLEEKALYEMVKVALTSPQKWSAIAPKMKFFNNPSFINAIGNSLYPTAWGSDNFIGHVDFGQFDDFNESFSACFGAVLLNAAVIKDIGLLDRHYKFYYEDMDWSFRAQVYGYPILTAPKAEIYHKFGASMSLKSQAFKARHIVGNRIYFTLKNLNPRTMKRFLSNYIYEDIRCTLFYIKHKNFPMVLAYIRGYLRLLVSFPALFYKRMKLQKRRKITDDRLIFAKAAPLNLTLMEDGAPKLDIYSLHANYTFLSPSYRPAVSDISYSETSDDFIIWRLHPHRDTKSLKKIYMEFSFHLDESGYYDIHLLESMRRNLTLYLDNQPINWELKESSINKKGRNKRYGMDVLAAQNVFISEGDHILKLEWRSHVQAVVLKKVL